jgi:hypothetical protein
MYIVSEMKRSDTFDTTKLTALELNCLFLTTFKNGENASKIHFYTVQYLEKK